MHVQGFCPQCNQQISSERHLTGYAICECGWFDNSARVTADKREEKKIIATMIFSAVFMAVLYGHMLNWGSYAFKIPFVKVAQVTGLLSKDGYLELAKTCVQLNKWACAQNAYVDLYHQSGDPEGLAQLAHLQVRLSEKALAETTYATYFKVGGKNADSAIEYGQLLEDNSKFDQALSYYEKSITLRPLVLPINATTSVVRLLIKIGKYQEAYDRIVDFHASAGNAEGYLNTELAQLEPKVTPSQKAADKPVRKRQPVAQIE